MPVLAQDFALPDNPEGYPLCDVAQYLVHYAQPGEPGTVYLYGHARRGMLLPLLEASQVDDGRDLLGRSVFVYTSDGDRYEYRITIVRRHAVDFSLANDIAPGEQRLVIQTSEGPSGTVPKLQVAAEPVAVVSRPLEEALPSPSPRACPPAS